MPRVCGEHSGRPGAPEGRQPHRRYNRRGGATVRKPGRCLCANPADPCAEVGRSMRHAANQEHRDVLPAVAGTPAHVPPARGGRIGRSSRWSSTQQPELHRQIARRRKSASVECRSCTSDASARLAQVPGHRVGLRASARKYARPRQRLAGSCRDRGVLRNCGRVPVSEGCAPPWSLRPPRTLGSLPFPCKSPRIALRITARLVTAPKIGMT